MSTEQPLPPKLSADGNFYWDGTRWVSMRAEVHKLDRPAQVDTTSVKGWLESIVALIGVFAVLLPVEGVLLRWASFNWPENSGGFQAPSATVAVGASLPELATTGLVGIYLPAFTFIVGVVFFASVDQILEKASARKSARWLVNGLLVVGMPFVGSLSGPNWLLPSVGYEAAAVTYLLLGNRNIGVVGGLLLAVVLAIVFAVGAGLSENPSNVEPLLYRFQTQAQTHLPDGRYVVLGRADLVSYLQSCADRTFHVVPDAQIVDARFVEHATSLGQPSVLQMILRWKGPVLGYRSDC